MSSLRGIHWSLSRYLVLSEMRNQKCIEELTVAESCRTHGEKYQIICFIWLLDQVKIQRIFWLSLLFHLSKRIRQKKKKQLHEEFLSILFLSLHCILVSIPYHSKTNKNVQSYFFMWSWQLSSIWNRIRDVIFSNRTSSSTQIYCSGD